MTQAAVDLEALAMAAIPPAGTTDVTITHVMTKPGGKLPSGDPSGLGAEFEWRVRWVLNGRELGDVIHVTPKVREALEFTKLVTGEKGALWERKQARRAAIEAMELAERQAEDDARATAEARKGRKRRVA